MTVLSKMGFVIGTYTTTIPAMTLELFQTTYMGDCEMPILLDQSLSQCLRSVVLLFTSHVGHVIALLCGGHKWIVALWFWSLLVDHHEEPEADKLMKKLIHR